MTAKDELLDRYEQLLDALRQAKGDERSELARRYAVAITETEKAMAYYKTFVLGFS